MKKGLIFLAYIFCLFILVSGLSSCNEPPEKPAEKEHLFRTVLVYQVANNNLGSSRFNEMDIQEMRDGAAAGSIPDDCRLLVYNAGPNADPLLLNIHATGVDTLKVYDNQYSSVQSERMLEVFADMRKHCPADEYGLVLWSHGSGWLQDGIDDPYDNGGIATLSFGSEKGKTMNISTLKNVLNAGEKFRFLYFDCCYMASVETVYELRETTPVIAASATELLVYGMPYDQNLSHFFSKEPDLVGAAKNTFALYDGQSGSNRTCSMGVVNTAGLEALAEATKAIYEKADGTMPAGYEPQRFMNKGISACEYFDFRQYVAALCIDSEGAERFDDASVLLQNFDNAMENCVLYSAATPMLWNSIPLKYHCGLSTYILQSADNADYKGYNTLEWYYDVVSALKF